MAHDIVCADSLTHLRELPDGLFDCCVTSPPYFGLRDYGISQWQGGDPACDHKDHTQHQKQGANSQRAGRSNSEAQRNDNFQGTCPLCGAVRLDHPLGLEPTPDLYVSRLVEVFREVRRVLAPTGTCWLVIGDSYARDAGRKTKQADLGKQSYTGNPLHLQSESAGSHNGRMSQGDRAPVRVGGDGLKPKDLIGIPWLTALALRSDGWYLRASIIWQKGNPLPESVRDRPTRSHEYIFLLTKSERYYWNSEAIAEPAIRSTSGNLNRVDSGIRGHLGSNAPWSGSFRNPRDVWSIPTHPLTCSLCSNCGSFYTAFRRKTLRTEGTGPARKVYCSKCQSPSHWVGHFAAFPPRLVEVCLLAGCPPSGYTLDPFGGAGTVAVVSSALSLPSYSIDLNPDYCRLARHRVMADPFTPSPPNSPINQPINQPTAGPLRDAQGGGDGGEGAGELEEVAGV